jgi:hypothetical protein
MRCRQVKRLLSAYDDGELSVSRQTRVQEHLHRCSDCREAFAELQAAMWLIEQEVQPTEPPPRFAQNVMAALPSPQEVRRQAQRRVHGFAFNCIAVTIIAWVTFNVWSQQPKTQNPKPKTQVVVSSSPLSAPKLEDELLRRDALSLSKMKTKRRAETRTRTKAQRPLIVVRQGTPRANRIFDRSQNLKPETQNPKPLTLPDEPVESSPAMIMVNLGSEVEQHATADVRTVTAATPHIVQRPRLTAELTSAELAWDGALSIDGG